MRIKNLFWLLLILSVSCGLGYADEFRLTAYYPSPSATYSQIRMIPQSAITPNTNCPLGSFYANSDDANNAIYYCAISGATTKYVPIPGTWTLDSNSLYLSDTASPLNKKISIGSTTPIFKLTLDIDGGILASGISAGGTTLTTSGAGTRLVWYPLKATFLAGKVDGTQWDDNQLTGNNILIGYNQSLNTCSACKLIGGEANSAGNNILSPLGSLVLGGKSNTVKNSPAFIAGGENNICQTTVTNSYIIGGYTNEINNSTYNSILGGSGNYVGEYSNQIAGGANNRIARIVHLYDSEGSSIIGGGLQNTISGKKYNVISGGRQNTITNDATQSSTIVGGRQNSATYHYLTISGGQSNTASYSANLSVISTISGGYSNTSTSTYSTISGGSTNSISANYTTIAGGYQNSITGQYSTIFGGQRNTISGTNSTILGGTDNTIASNYSLAFGKNMKLGASATNSFLWGYSNSPLASPIQTDHAFMIYSGNVGIRDTSPAALLEINANGLTDDLLAVTSNTSATVGDEFMVKNNGYIGVGTPSPSYPLQFANGAYVTNTGQFMSASSRSYKEKIKNLSSQESRQLVDKLVAVSFNYKNSKNESYLGFIAEDVPDALADSNHKGLSPLDFAAALTQVVKSQQKILAAQSLRREKLQQRINVLKKQAAELKRQGQK